MKKRLFLIASTQQEFNTALNLGKIEQEDIVFIASTGRIWTHGSYYGSSSVFSPEENDEITQSIGGFSQGEGIQEYSGLSYTEMFERLLCKAPLILDIQDLRLSRIEVDGVIYDNPKYIEAKFISKAKFTFSFTKSLALWKRGDAVWNALSDESKGFRWESNSFEDAVNTETQDSTITIQSDIDASRGLNIDLQVTLENPIYPLDSSGQQIQGSPSQSKVFELFPAFSVFYTFSSRTDGALENMTKLMAAEGDKLNIHVDSRISNCLIIAYPEDKAILNVVDEVGMSIMDSFTKKTVTYMAQRYNVLYQTNKVYTPYGRNYSIQLG